MRFIVKQDLWPLICHLPLRKLAVDYACMTKLNDEGCQLKVDKLEITDSCSSDIFYLQNFVVSEIITQEGVSEYMDEIKAAHKENKLRLVLSTMLCYKTLNK